MHHNIFLRMDTKAINWLNSFSGRSLSQKIGKKKRRKELNKTLIILNIFSKIREGTSMDRWTRSAPVAPTLSHHCSTAPDTPHKATGSLPLWASLDSWQCKQSKHQKLVPSSIYLAASLLSFHLVITHHYYYIRENKPSSHWPSLAHSLLSLTIDIFLCFPYHFAVVVRGGQ